MKDLWEWEKLALYLLTWSETWLINLKLLLYPCLMATSNNFENPQTNVELRLVRCTGIWEMFCPWHLDETPKCHTLSPVRKQDEGLTDKNISWTISQGSLPSPGRQRLQWIKTPIQRVVSVASDSWALSGHFELRESAAHSLPLLDVPCQSHFGAGDNPNEGRPTPKITEVEANPEDIYWGDRVRRNNLANLEMVG